MIPDYLYSVRSYARRATKVICGRHTYKRMLAHIYLFLLGHLPAKSLAVANAFGQASIFEFTTSCIQERNRSRCVIHNVSGDVVSDCSRLQCTEPGCEASFLKHHQLRKHTCTTHAPPGTKPYRCQHPGCDKSFLTNQKLRGHAKMHDGKCISSLAGRTH
jgi:hypothetical protein